MATRKQPDRRPEPWRNSMTRSVTLGLALLSGSLSCAVPSEIVTPQSPARTARPEAPPAIRAATLDEAPPAGEAANLDEAPTERGPGVAPGAVEGGVPGGSVQAPLGPLVSGPPGNSAAGAPVDEPIASVMQHAIYTPAPSTKKLEATRTGKTSREPGRVRVAFCVAEHGRPTRVRVETPFGSDPEIDRACEETVRKWRFKPFVQDGKYVVVCTSVVFSIKFK